MTAATPARFTLVENPDGTVTNDWELRDDTGQWRPWRHTTMTRVARPTSTTREDDVLMKWTLEVVCVPVSDVDRAKAFYAEQLGFDIDHDTVQSDDVRVVQLTPPGSGCSIVVGKGAVPDMAPGSLQGLQLVVPDIRAAHAELVERGVDVTDIQVYGPDGLRPSRDGEALDNVGFVFFSDPDGNGWAVQQISARAG